jgi:hypothetical protein
VDVEQAGCEIERPFSMNGCISVSSLSTCRLRRVCSREWQAKLPWEAASKALLWDPSSDE